MKPRLKNVTAEDVASSLYYVHHDRAEDQILLEEYKMPKAGNNAQDGEQQPLLERPSQPFDTLIPPSSLSPQIPPSQTGEIHHINRKPVPPPSFQSDTVDTVIAATRLPLGQLPEPLSVGKMSGDLERIHRKPVNGPDKHASRENLASSSFEQLSISGEHSGQLGMQAKTSFDDFNLQKPPNTCSFKCFSLTLIRRDPSSGQQWNVGKIYSESYPLDSSPHKFGHIEIEITN